MHARRLPLLSSVIALSLLSACGGTSDGNDGGDNSSPSGSKEASSAVEIVDSGFGQSDVYVQGIVVVTTDSDSSIGEFVTVSVNFIDADGQIVATEEQTESFSWTGQELVLPVSLDLSAKPGVTVAKIEPSASISEHGTSKASKAALPVLETTGVTAGKYGGFTAAFSFMNETDEDLKNLRTGVVCYDTAGKIIGGTHSYPDLAPAGKTIVIDADPIVSEQPSTCKMFSNYGA